jgi:putative phage-type endonuclease
MLVEKRQASEIIDQRTDAWFEERLGKATASHFGDLMANGRGGGEAVARKDYRLQLVAERLTGKKAETFTSKEMQWGTENEGLARFHYMVKSGNDVEECGFFQHPTLMAGASPDGLVNSDGLVEIKCPKTSTHVETLKTGKVPTAYYWQMTGQMLMTGRKWCDFVSFDPRLPANASLFITRVMRSEEDIRRLEQTIAEFLVSVDVETKFIKNYRGV